MAFKLCTNMQLSQYKCRNCDFSTYHLVKFKKHSRVTHEYSVKTFTRYECKSCPFITYSFLIYFKHLQSHNTFAKSGKKKVDFEEIDQVTENGITLYKCKCCQHKLKVEKSLKEHIKIHHFKQQFKCIHCNFTTGDKSCLRKHIQRKHNSNKKLFTCEICDKQFTEKYTLKRHVVVVHISIDLLECKDCSFKCKSEEYLRRHIKKHHTPENKPVFYHCSKCNYKSQKMELLRKHELLKHAPDDSKMEFMQHFNLKDNWLHCGKCLFKTNDKTQFNNHIQRLHISREALKQGNPLKENLIIDWHHCTYCPYKVKVKKKLEEHILKQHTSQKLKRDFKIIVHENNLLKIDCKDCGSFFKSRSELERHYIFKHTPDEEIKWFKCEKCDYKGKFKYMLTRHFNRRHL